MDKHQPNEAPAPLATHANSRMQYTASAESDVS